MIQNPPSIRKSTYYPNMDLVRYLLALAVIVAHTNAIAGFHIPFPITSFEAVGGFFALSGFLMYPNYVRHNNCLKYLRQRAQRILPPYIFIVVAAAIFLVFISTLSPSQYFSSSGFWVYLGANLSFLNWLHPGLPGVFEGAGYSTSAVNASLWTMKIEWCLYFSVPLFIFLLTRIKRLSKAALALIVIALSIGYRIIFMKLYQESGREIFYILSRQVFGQLSYFYCGMLVYFAKDFFTRHLTWMVVAGIALVWISRTLIIGNIILNPFGITLAVLGISLLPYDIPFLHHRNNVSYEMYLFHFPIIQLSIFFGINQHSAWLEYLYVLAATIALSVIVHIGIERIRKS